MSRPSKINAWYGWLPDRPDYRDKLYASIARAPKKLPPATDLRATCSGVEDQGAVGSCTACALVGNLEFLARKARRPLVNLSRLFVYYNERVIIGTVDEDSGAMLRDGIKTLVKQGVCHERKWPYRPSKLTAKPAPACYKQALDHQVLSYHRVLSLREMKMCLAEGYPFVFGFTVYEAFESDAVAQHGRLEMPQDGEGAVGGHAVMAVGYDDATQRFLIRNSWGRDWGLQGYYTMPYDYLADRNLSEDFWTIRAFENP